MSSRSSGRALGPLQALAMLLAFILAAVTGGVLLAGLAVPAVTAAGSISNATTGIFDEGVEDFVIEEPSEMSTMYAGDGSLMTNFFQNERLVVASEDISQHIKDATVAVEDRRFYDHIGVDVEGLARAVVMNFFNNQNQGASTITQQLIKNAKIEEGVQKDDLSLVYEATQQTYGRKLEEARLAIALEKKYSKDEILTGYLNLAQYGVRVWGVEAAAQHYFNRSAADVTIAQAAMLAAIPQAPGRWDPTVNPSEAKDRRDKVLRDMRDEDYITPAEYNEAVGTSIEDMLDVTNRRQGCAATGNMAYFCTYVVHSILLDPTFGETEEERQNFLNRGGLQIYTTIDPDKQQAAFESVTNHVPINDPSNVKITLSSVEPGTGRIVAMAQNTNFGKPSEEDPTATEMNLNVDRAHGGSTYGFETGSSYKAIVLATWLKNGNTLGDIVDGNKTPYTRSDFTISCAPDLNLEGPWEPKNLEGAGGDRISVLNATRVSANRAYVEMASLMDLCDVKATAESMGLKQGDGSPIEPNPGSVLGSNSIAPLDMAAAFATFATNGTFCSTVAIERIVDSNGNEVPVPETECTKVLEDEVAAGVNYALQEVNKPGGTGARAALSGRITAGKTGTANDNKYAWYVGYTPQLSAAVMMGYQEGAKSMNRQVINGQWRQIVYAGLISAPAWRDYMVRALDGEPVERFPDPRENRTVYGDFVQAPSVVGLGVTRAQARLEEQDFTLRVSDEQIYSDYPAGYIAAQSPGSGTRVPKGSVITVQISQGPEPQPEPPPAEDDDDRRGRDDDDRRGRDDDDRRGRDDD